MQKLQKGYLIFLVAFGACSLADKPGSVVGGGDKTVDKIDLKKVLTSEQYACTQEGATERPFANAYWDNKADGIYLDVVTKVPLFSSLDKYDSGSGWPSFDKPVNASAIQEKSDKSMGLVRTEVRTGASHLGHVFDDGPKETTGKRYCINSAALEFVPLEQMKARGFGSMLFDFAQKKGWQIAVVAGGCFWGLESLMGRIEGVIETQVGYAGGTLESPTYPVVSTGKTGYAETVRILFDPKVQSYENILKEFFRDHDPTTVDQQGNDRGSQYRSAIFAMNADQAKIAKKVIELVNQTKFWKDPVATEVKDFTRFWPAEPEHQKYLARHPDGYSCHYVRKVKY